jgi:hypothetical protein
MKKLYALAGVLMLAVMLSSIGLATAADLNPTMDVLGKGIVWVVNTRDVTDFSGKDATSIQAWWGAGEGWNEITPRMIVQTDKTIMLIFDPATLQGIEATETQVTGFVGELTFTAAGPGFVWANIH